MYNKDKSNCKLEFIFLFCLNLHYLPTHQTYCEKSPKPFNERILSVHKELLESLPPLTTDETDFINRKKALDIKIVLYFNDSKK